jgi:hypothetical protein
VNVGIGSNVGRYQNYSVSASIDNSGVLNVATQLCEEAPCEINPAPGILAVRNLVIICKSNCISFLSFY